MAGYAVPMKRTASTSLAVGNIIADATRPRRYKLFDLMAGYDGTPADAAAELSVQRCTTAGTATAVTPRPLDPADAATEMDANENHTVDPTITANSSLLALAFNQRASIRWVASPGKELVVPATASNGLVFKTPTTPTVAITVTAHVEEQ
jgi:hypothetical protein